MKNLMFLIVLLISTASFAQIEADTQLNINLADVHSIEVTNPLVTIDMNAPIHFTQGNETGVLNNHIITTATSSYTVEVRADADQFKSTTSSTPIDVNTVRVIVVGLGDDLTSNSTITPTFTSSNQWLSSTDQEILAVNNGDLQRGFNMNYRIPISTASQYIGKDPDVYSTTVTYTLIPQ